MPVIDWILNALGILENIFSAAIVAILTYMICGGWKFVFRAISFFFDTQLVKLIGTVFSYFNQLLTMEMFSEELMNELLRNVYVFIGVIMFFRLILIFAFSKWNDYNCFCFLVKFMYNCCQII